MNPSQTPSVDTQPTELEALRDRVFPKAQRRLTGPLRAIVTVASVGLTVFTLYMGFHITLGPIVTRAAHLMVVIPLAFLLYPARKQLPHGGPSPVDYFLAAAASAAFAWAIVSAERFEARFAYFDPVEPLDLVFGVLALVTVFEATRRTVGSSIVVLNLVFIVYALTGPYWPGVLQHKGTSFLFLIEHLYMLSDGLFNFITGIMATFLFTFLAFGAFLRVSGADRFFTDFAFAVAGNRRGGPAKVAIISSALMGMLSGSTVSNVATTGTMTIPMMIRMGFKPHEAGAIESTASLGGALMPPLMGAGVFIMAAFTGVPLVTILGYSILPAVLYFASIYFHVESKARKEGIKPIPLDQLPRVAEVAKTQGHVVLPILVLISLLLMDYTPFFASSASVLTIVAVSMLRQSTRLTPPKLLAALEATTRVAVTVSSLSASAAVIYGVITATGLLVKVTSILLSAADGSVFIAIVLIAAMSYILGMGLPVTASYVLIAALGAPALADMGLPILAAHLIIFWFSQDSTITPPICMTAFVAASIAEASPMRTGWECVRMAKALYIVPFMFAFSGLLSDSPTEIFFDFAVLFCALALLPLALEGYWTRPLHLLERAILSLVSAGFLKSALGPAEAGWPWAVVMSIVAGATLVRSARRAESEDRESIEQ